VFGSPPFDALDRSGELLVHLREVRAVPAPRVFGPSPAADSCQ
jgi:hypothetical protein